MQAIEMPYFGKAFCVLGGVCPQHSILRLEGHARCPGVWRVDRLPVIRSIRGASAIVGKGQAGQRRNGRSTTASQYFQSATPIVTSGDTFGERLVKPDVGKN